jgi:hypothetical protein
MRVYASIGGYSFSCVFVFISPSLNLPRLSAIYGVLTEAPKRHLWRLGRTGGLVVMVVEAWIG